MVFSCSQVEEGLRFWVYSDWKITLMASVPSPIRIALVVCFGLVMTIAVVS